MKSAKPVYQLKIELDNIAPAIWRRVLVPSNVTLRRMHGIIQGTMGWTGLLPHRFQQDGREFGRPDPDGDMYLEDDSRFRLDYLLMRAGQSVAYEYDFDDSWAHTILLEKILSIEEAGTQVRCLAGARACPFEHCGGVAGYQAFLEVTLDPFHPMHRKSLQWVGGKFDPEAFDLEGVNRAMASRRKVRITTVKPVRPQPLSDVSSP
jgi:hypothetical protein